MVLGADILDRAASDEGLRELYEAQTQEDRACANHILVQAGDGSAEPTEAQFAEALAEIETIAGQLDGTDDFGALAAEFSDDPGSASAGGELGCAPEGTYVAEFDEVVWSQPIGEVSEPVRTSFGYHLILVTARGEVSFEDARSQLARAVQQNGQAIIGDALAGLLTDADVSVDPKWGRWDAESGQVLPPAGAQPPPMPTPDLEGLDGLPEGLFPAEG
nr:peptidylprolyl isomerase [Rhabdothermincola salaria]